MTTRTAYLLDDDRKMLEFLYDKLKQSCADAFVPCGKSIWKSAFKAKVTYHSSQSMQSRFSKILSKKLGLLDCDMVMQKYIAQNCNLHFHENDREKDDANMTIEIFEDDKQAEEVDIDNETVTKNNETASISSEQNSNNLHLSKRTLAHISDDTFSVFSDSTVSIAHRVKAQNKANRLSSITDVEINGESCSGANFKQPWPHFDEIEQLDVSCTVIGEQTSRSRTRPILNNPPRKQMRNASTSPIKEIQNANILSNVEQSTQTSIDWLLLHTTKKDMQTEKDCFSQIEEIQNRNKSSNVKQSTQTPIDWLLSAMNKKDMQDEETFLLEHGCWFPTGLYSLSSSADWCDRIFKICSNGKVPKTKQKAIEFWHQLKENYGDDTPAVD